MPKRVMSNFTATAIQEFLTSPDEPTPEQEQAAAPPPAEKKAASKSAPAPVESQGEPPALTMDQV